MIKPTLYAAALLAVSSAAFAPMPASAQVDFNLVIGTAPPPLRFESLPPPRHGYVWAPGFWNWDGYRHVWVAGHWLRERPGYYYTQPQWVQSDGHWVRHEGRWDRRGRGDLDRDGIPNRYDHDRDGDGIPNRYDNHPNRSYDHYRAHGRGYERGYQRTYDNDRDGIPNRHDRDRDGDGVPNRYDYRPDNPYRN